MDEVARAGLEILKPVFLPDVPLGGEADEETRFGHGGVAETLRTVVACCPAPFTIALYGSWGTGKSSVVGRVGHLLARDGIPAVVVDVWKYQDDPLRRIVLREMDRQGRADFPRYDRDFKLDERIELETSLATEFKLGFVFNRVSGGMRKSRQAACLLVLLLLMAGIGALWVKYPSQLSPFVASVAGAVGAALAILGAVALLLTPKTRTSRQGRYSDPFEFQNEFSRILTDGFRHASRVLVVFDNLDRVSSEKSVEVLATIKTFLEATPLKGKPKAVFMVPCDDDAILRQVRERFEGDGNDDDKGDEFLRKFFNVTLRLPRFLSTELEQYAADLARDTTVPALDDPRIAWIIAKAFRDNPRQVKQFLNVLVAEYMLVHTRSVTGELPPGFACQNALQLTLYLLLRTRFPNDMAEILDQRVPALNPEALKEHPSVASFVEQVAHEVEIDNLEDWLTLRRSKHEMDLPGVDQFLLALQDADFDAAWKYISGLDREDATHHNLSLAVQQRLLDIKNTTAFVSAFDTLLRVLAEDERRLDPTTMGDLVSRTAQLVQREPARTTTRVDPWRLAEIGLDDLARCRSQFVAAWVNQIHEYATDADAKRDSAFLGGLMPVMARRPDWFQEHQQQLQSDLPGIVGKNETLVAALVEGEGGKRWATPALAARLAESIGEV